MLLWYFAGRVISFFNIRLSQGNRDLNMKRSVAISKGTENGRGMYHYLIQSSVFQILATLKLSLCDQGGNYSYTNFNLCDEQRTNM